MAHSATDVYYSNFIGDGAGANTITAHHSNFIGYQAGISAITSSYSNHIGYNAGYSSLSTNYSIFIGYNSGYETNGASNSVFIGKQAGYQDIVDNSTTGYSILLGNYITTSGYSNSILIGSGSETTFGENTMSNQLMIGTSENPINYLNIRGLNYELPSTHGDPLSVLTNDGSGILSWVSASTSVTVGGVDKNIQINSGDTLYGTDYFSYDYDLNSLNVGNNSVTSSDAASIGGSGNTVSHNSSIILGGYDFTTTDANTVYMPMAEIFTNGEGIILSSPNGTRYKVTVDNDGNLLTTSMSAIPQ